MRTLLLFVVIVLGLSGCAVYQSKGPQVELRPIAREWHFDQKSRQPWQDITESLTPVLAQLKQDSVLIRTGSESKRAQAIYAWLVKKGVPKTNIERQHQPIVGVTVKLVRYQVKTQVCSNVRILYQITDHRQHLDPCETELMRWKSFAHPEHMVATGD